MDVELEGIGSSAELRRGMLQGYRELLGVQLPAHALRVHARLQSGSTVQITDATPLSESVLGAVSFYVWAVLERQDVHSMSTQAEVQAQRVACGIGAAPCAARGASTTPWPPPAEPILGAETPTVHELKGALGVAADPGLRRKLL